MNPTAEPLRLTPSEQVELASVVRSTRAPAGLVKRAQIVLAIAAGESYASISSRLHVPASTISRWRKRYTELRFAGLQDAQRSGRPKRITPQIEAKIIATTQKPPPSPYTHWSASRLARHVGVSPSTVQRIWKKAHLKPHRLEHYKASPDPAFEEKAAAIIGLYLNPPAHAAVFCVDEKTAIQALERTDPVLPLSPGRAERHGFEYVRHGTLSLYAALEVSTGRVHGKTAQRHTSEEFLGFCEQVIATQPAGREIHLIVDNLSAHKTKAVQAWLVATPNVKIHYTPTYSSWLNQVELWFAKIERDCIARGIFTSTDDLRRKLLAYISAHNEDCRPFKWIYSDTSRRIRASKTSDALH
jgi:transposase